MLQDSSNKVCQNDREQCNGRKAGDHVGRAELFGNVIPLGIRLADSVSDFIGNQLRTGVADHLAHCNAKGKALGAADLPQRGETEYHNHDDHSKYEDDQCIEADDRNIRKVRGTMFKKIRKKLLAALTDKAEKQQPMTLLEKEFLRECGLTVDNGTKKQYNR